MDYKDEKGLGNGVLSPEKAKGLVDKMTKDKKRAKDAEKLVNAALGDGVFEREERPVKKDNPGGGARGETAKVVRKWRDQPKQVKENMAGSLEDKVGKKRKAEKKRTKQAKKKKKSATPQKGKSGARGAQKQNKKDLSSEVLTEEEEKMEKPKNEEGKDRIAEATKERQKAINEMTADKDIKPSVKEIAEENQKKIDETFKKEGEAKGEKESGQEKAESAEESKTEAAEAAGKEKTKEEFLEVARGEFARMDLMAEGYIKAEKKLKFKRTKEDFVKYGGNGGREYAEAKEKYFETLRARRQEMINKILEKIEAMNLPEKKKDKKMKKLFSEITKETIAREANYLYDKKTELGLEGKEKESKFEKILNVSKKVVEKYRKMPLKYKLMISAGLLAGGIAAGAIGGATGAALVTGIVAGKWFQRVLGGSAAAVGLEGLIKRSQEKKAEKKMSVEFADSLMESIKNGDKKLDERLLELEGKKKWEKYRRFALAGSMGALIASGWTAKAIGAIIPGIWTDWTMDKIGLGTEAEKVGGMDPERLAQMETLSKMSFVEVAEKGDSIWKMAEDQLEKHYGERFSDLNPAQKTYAIDAIKDKIAANPKAFGLDDIDKLKVGQKIDFSSIFEDEKNLDNIFDKAEDLRQAALDNIESNNQILEDWVKEHPGEALSSGKIDEILTGTEVVNIDLNEALALKNIEVLGFSPDEYNAIKGVTVGKLLEEIPSKEEAWEVWHSGKGIDLPHDGIYSVSEFGKHIKLAELIRGFEPGANIKQMTVSQFLRTINK